MHGTKNIKIFLLAISLSLTHTPPPTYASLCTCSCLYVCIHSGIYSLKVKLTMKTITKARRAVSTCQYTIVREYSSGVPGG